MMTLEGGMLLVSRTAAQAQLATDTPSATTTQSGGSQPGDGGGEATGQPSGSAQPKRFYATVELDPVRPGPLVSQIAQSILVELQRSRGAKVKVRLDIEGEAPDGYTDDVVSVVRDNASTLKLDASFETD
jgi:hypothetical protein